MALNQLRINDRTYWQAKELGADQLDVFKHYTDGIEARVNELSVLPLSFYLNLDPHRKQPALLNGLFLIDTIVFMSTSDGWMRQVARDILREAKIDNEDIDLILNGHKLSEDYSSQLNFIPNMDYSLWSQSTVYSTFKMGDGVNVAISGKHSKTGKPMILNSIDGPANNPSFYYLCGISWMEN
jgi:hypothetical protein